jgi:hypothetical protein
MVGAGIFGAFLIVLFFITLIPLMLVVVLKNLGLYRGLSKARRLILYVVSFFLITVIFSFTGIYKPSSNGGGLFFLYMFFLFFGSFAFQNVSNATLNKARWIIACLTFAMLLLVSLV